MSIEEAIEKVKENYEIAKKTALFIFDPISFALYRTWEEYNIEKQKGKSREV